MIPQRFATYSAKSWKDNLNANDSIRSEAKRGISEIEAFLAAVPASKALVYA